VPSPDNLRLTIKWLILPNGLSADGQDLVFSVFAAPALAGNETGGPLTLASFPDLLDWPGTLAGVDFGVEFDGSGQRVTARLLPRSRSSAAWQSLFAATTTVLPFLGEDLTGRPVMTFSSGSVLETLRHSYARLVVDAIDDLPLIAPMAPAPASGEQPFAAVATALQHPVMRALLSGREARAATFRTLASNATTRAGSPTGMIEMLAAGAAGDGPSGEIVKAVAFHAAQEASPPPAPDPGQAAADRAALLGSVDFHKIISSLNEHPALLRHLGLVFDVAVPRSATAKTSGTVRLLPRWTSRFPSTASQKADLPLWVAWQLDPAAALPFTAAAAGLPGVLDVGSNSPFSVHPMALDSAMLQAVAMVSALPAGGTHSAPPAVRSGGLTVTHADRGQAVHADLAAATQGGRGATPQSALHAEDVVRCYRLDVSDADHAGWFSLHARQVRYTKGDSALIDPVLDEGSHHPSATGPAVAPGAEPGASAPIYLHESFVRWDGWSLSAPRPGRSLGVDPSGPDPDRPETMPQRTTNDPLTQAGLRIETRVQPRTLPRLRFGHRYQVRVRTVDLAGNGIDLATANALWQQPSVTVRPSGHQVVPAALGSPATLFARFEPVSPPVIIQATPEPQSMHRLVVRSATDDPALEVASAECRLYAPKGSVELAERHGRFDDAIGSADLARIQASYDVAARESGVLPDAGSDELPYLPDPLSIGVAMAGAPGIVAGTTPGIEWRGSSWDRPKPVTLRVQVNDLHFQPAPDIDQDALSVTIKLDPARRATLRISSLIPDGTPFGLMDWLGEDAINSELDEDTKRRLRRAIDDSRHVMFTPWEEIEVIHAVQRPLAAPDLQSEPDVARKPGDTDFQPNSTLVREPLSTGTVQLNASWTDVVDDPAVRFEAPADGAPMPWLRPVSSVVGSTALDEPELVEGVVPLMPRTDLYFPGSVMPRLQFSDTRRRTVTLTAVAMSRFADEFPELAGQPEQFTRTGTAAVAVVQSTARPPAPAVADVVPVVSTGAVSLSTGTLVREGGWVRVWLERPWFVTGEGEMLGVVVMDQTPAGPADHMYDYVSLAGRDAAHTGGPIAGLRAENLVNAVAVEQGVMLPEPVARFGVRQTHKVSVAQFAPEFDFTSQRWFADIRISQLGAAYFPMVRLAVVRYQPNSVAAPLSSGFLSTHQYFVSPVVTLDPIPLFPDRQLKVTKVIKPTHALLQLELSGTPYVATSSLTSQRDAKAPALARVTARPRTRIPIALAVGEPWMNGTAVPFKRDDPTKPWRLQLENDQIRNLGDGVEQILVVEEDHLPSDPAVPDSGLGVPAAEPFAARTVFAAVIEGPFLPASQ
jgi:hypothetical protein